MPRTAVNIARPSGGPDLKGPMDLDLSPEDLVLVTCARRRLLAEDSGRLLSLVSSSLDWRRLLQGAEWHKLQGLLYRHLSAEPFASKTPPVALRMLHDMFRRTAVRQVVFQRELVRILSAFKEMEIEVVLLKGAALVNEVYGDDAGVRPMVDLDLLVRPGQAERADGILRDMGFRPAVDDETQMRMKLVDRQLAALARPGSPVVVELHTHLVEANSPVRFDVGYFWQNRRKAVIAGVPASVLEPTPLLAAQAINFLKDRRFYSYAALGQLCDVAEVVRQYSTEIEWETFGAGGELSRLRGVLFGALYPARHILAAPVPEDVLHGLTPTRFRPAVAANMARDRVFGREWLAKDLAGGNGTYSAWQVPWLMLKRVFLSRGQVEYRAKSGAAPSRFNYMTHNLKRLWDAFRLGLRFLSRPRKLYEDISVDRWLKSLYNSTE
jgi:hypothetical protein